MKKGKFIDETTSRIAACISNSENTHSSFNFNQHEGDHSDYYFGQTTLRPGNPPAH
jgi:hypothetical protein